MTWASPGYTLTVLSFPASSRASRRPAWLSASSNVSVSTQLMAAAMDCCVTGAAFSCHFTGAWDALQGITWGRHQAVVTTAVSPQLRSCEQHAPWSPCEKKQQLPALSLKMTNKTRKPSKTSCQSTIIFHQLKGLRKTMFTGNHESQALTNTLKLLGQPDG